MVSLIEITRLGGEQFKRMNVLFIGNSHTYLHFMPLMLVELVNTEDRGFTVSVAQCTDEGVGLEWHWNNQATRDMIGGKKWEYVVLQDRSGGPLEERASFEIHARMLDGEIKKQGAQTVFFMTWALKSEQKTQANLAAVYGQMAEELRAKIAPVGLAWQKVRQLNPDIDLYHKDGRHANPVGAYLTACVFYAVILGASPEGLPGTLLIKGKERVTLDKYRALFLQKIAYETVSNSELRRRNAG